MKNISLTTLGLAILGLIFCLADSASAQPAGQTNYQWSAGGDQATWSQGANWTQGIQPQTNGTTFQIDTFVNAGGSMVPMNLAPTDVVNINDAIFGPLWGQTLNIFGTVYCGFGEFSWGDMNGPTTTINVQTNASLTLRDTLALGTAWWFPGGPNVVMNVYSNAQVNVTWLQFGARLNLYGGRVIVTNGFNTGTATGPVFVGGLDTDATRSINLTAGSMLVLPNAYTATVNDWIARGILQVYGSPGNGSQIVIDEADTNWVGRTVVTTTATNANPILAVRIEVPRTNLFVGGVEQAQVFADYATVTNVNVTTVPGIGITYQSTPTTVATVAANGRVRAVAPGSATVKAIVGALSNTVSVAVAVYTNTPALAHRYSFSSAVEDSIGGPDWDGIIIGGSAVTDGKLVLDGVNGYAQLPPGIITNMNAVTVETWASFSNTIPVWAVLFTFGDTDGTFGHYYLSCQPHTGPGTAQTGIKNFGSEQNPFFTPPLDGYSNVLITAVFHPEAGFCSIYTNGVLAGINNNIIITMAEVTTTGDPLNYIGRSLYSQDPYLPGSVDEFRIYNGPLTAGQIKAGALLGPNQLIGTSTSVSLSASLSGGNIVIRWPTNSALVTLMSSPVLGAGATWTQVPTATMTLNGGNYQVTRPTGGAAQYFRLQK